MKTCLKTRAIALVAAFFVTTTIVQLIVNHALPEDSPVVLAQLTTGR
jgi:hypothetical protein